MRSQQNLPGAVVAGIASAMVGAVVWAAVTVATDYQIGWMAVGVGFIVGVAVREVGKGVDTSFGMVGAVMSALGCATGNVLAICGLIANQQELGILDVVGQLNATAVIALMIATFSPMDLLFYGIAVYEGYRFSFRRISQEDLADTLEDRGVSTRPMMPNRLSIAVIVALAIAAWSVLTRPPEIHQIPDGAQLRFALTGWDLVESSESRKVWMNSDGDELSMDRVEGSSALAPFDDLDGVRSRSRDLARAAGGGILSADVLDLGRMTAVTLIHKREELRAYAYTGLIIVPAESEHFVITITSTERGTTGVRDSLATVTLLQEGQLDLPAESGQIPGWRRDPYDPQFDHAAVNSVADDPRFDELLPDHPLSQVRRTLRLTTESLELVE